MIIACFICFGILCVSMSVLYGIYGEKENGIGSMLSSFMVLSTLAFALVVSNLNSLSTAFTIFLFLAMASMVASLCIDGAEIELERKEIIKKVFYDVALLLFAVSFTTLGEFNYLTVLVGALCGLCVGLLVWAIKKEHGAIFISSSIVGYVAMGIMLACCVWNILLGMHLVSAICALCGSGLIFISMAMESFGREYSKVRLIFRLFLAVGLMAIALSTYFF